MSNEDLFKGHDATEAFEDVGHSDEARALLPNLYVGDFDTSGVSQPISVDLLILNDTSSYKGSNLKSAAAATQEKNNVSSAVEQGSK